MLIKRDYVGREECGTQQSGVWVCVSPKAHVGDAKPDVDAEEGGGGESEDTHCGGVWFEHDFNLKQKKKQPAVALLISPAMSWPPLRDDSGMNTASQGKQITTCKMLKKVILQNQHTSSMLE